MKLTLMSNMTLFAVRLAHAAGVFLVVRVLRSRGCDKVCANSGVLKDVVYAHSETNFSVLVCLRGFLVATL